MAFLRFLGARWQTDVNYETCIDQMRVLRKLFLPHQPLEEAGKSVYAKASHKLDHCGINNISIIVFPAKNRYDVRENEFMKLSSCI